VLLPVVARRSAANFEEALADFEEALRSMALSETELGKAPRQNSQKLAREK
jgi:hypothetical protein